MVPEVTEVSTEVVCGPPLDEAASSDVTSTSTEEDEDDVSSRSRDTHSRAPHLCRYSWSVQWQRHLYPPREEECSNRSLSQMKLAF